MTRSAGRRRSCSGARRRWPPSSCSSSRSWRWSLAADWAGLLDQLALRAAPRGAAALGLVTSTVAMLICLVLGLPLAWVLARVDFRGRGLLRALVAVPLVLPPVVAGIALRTAFGRSGVHRRAAARRDRLRVPVHDVGRRAGARLRLDAVRGDQRSRARCAPRARSTTPRRPRSAPPAGPTFRRVTVPLALPGHRRRDGAGLGPVARRVRRDHHLQRQLPRHHPDDADADLRHPPGRPGRRARAQPGDAAGLGRRAARAARPLAGDGHD